MDPSVFKPDAPGQLVPIMNGRQAFIPAPLPVDWEFPARLWPLLARAKEKIGLLEGIGRSLPNPSILLRPLRDREALCSSRLEGTVVAPRDLLLFELAPREPQSQDDPANEWREVSNYGRALQYGIETDLPLSLRLIRDLHRILMTGVRGKDACPGEFRTHQVGIGVPPRFIPPPPERVLDCLDRFEKSLHETPATVDPLVDCFLAHYQFEAIHPFADGNGRVGRLLLALMIQQRCCLTKPWLYLSAYFDRNRDEYFRRLFHVSTSNDWESWMQLCLQGAAEQADDTIRRCERLLAVREDYFRRIADVGGSVRLNSIVDGVFDSPFVQVSALGTRLGVTYRTAQKDIERLVAAGVLEELEAIYPKTFYARSVFDVVYDPLDTETVQ